MRAEGIISCPNYVIHIKQLLYASWIHCFGVDLLFISKILENLKNYSETNHKQQYKATSPKNVKIPT